MKESIITGYAINKDVASKAQSEKTRTVTFIASTPTPDRDMDVTNSKGWNLENFNKNPVIGYQHQVVSHGLCIAPDPDDIIGVGKNLKVDDKGRLLVDITFEDADVNPKADKIFKKVMAGTLSAVSVGFIPVKNDNGEVSRKGMIEKGEIPEANYLFGQDLLEISVVNVPANPEAVALRKNIKSQVAGAVVNLSKMLDKGYDDLEKMTVGQVVKALEGSSEWVVSRTDDLEENESKDSEKASKDGAVDIRIIEAEISIKQKQIENE